MAEDTASAGLFTDVELAAIRAIEPLYRLMGWTR
jgi:hypothetical protein